MNNLTLHKMIDLHKDKRVFVIGTAPSLNDVTTEQIKKIEQATSIGVNFSHIQITPTYWIAGGHGTQIAFAAEFLDPRAVALFHCDPGSQWQYPQVDRINFFDDIAISPHQTRPLTRYPNNNTIIGGYNILLSASHIAYIIGAKEIVYIGFEQVNRLHFYNLWDKSKQEIFKNKLKFVRKKYEDNKVIVDCITEILNVSEPDKQRWCHFKPIDVCRNLSFKEEGKYHVNYPIFKNYVNQFKEDGIKVYTTATEGIAVEAGAEIVDLNEMLE